MARVRSQRQQANQNVGLAKKGIELRFAVKTADAFDLLCTAAPAGDAKAESAQNVGCVGPQRAQSHDADRDRARGELEFRLPALLALRLPQIWLLPVMHQHM